MNIKKEYKITNEIENIQKIIDESNEYINSDDVINIIDKVLDNLLEEINDLIQENYNNLNLNKETIEDLITKIPNNIEDIVNFPINLIDYINEITKKKKENSSVINEKIETKYSEELLQKIVTQVNLFQLKLKDDSVSNSLKKYFENNKAYITIAQNIVDVYKLKISNPNFQILKNIINLKNNINNLNNNILDIFTKFQSLMNDVNNKKNFISSYQEIKNEYPNIIDKLSKFKEINFISSLEYTSYEINTELINKSRNEDYDKEKNNKNDLKIKNERSFRDKFVSKRDLIILNWIYDDEKIEDIPIFYLEK